MSPWRSRTRLYQEFASREAEELDQELDAFMKDEITAAFSCQALVSR